MVDYHETTFENKSELFDIHYDQPPEPLLSDYIEMCYLLVVILIGLPLNIHVFFGLLHQMRKTPKNSVKVSLFAKQSQLNNITDCFQRSFILLKINLNISDLLLILIQANGKLLWLWTYEWKGGDLVCRVFNFLTMFTLYLSSNIIGLLVLRTFVERPLNFSVHCI